MSNSKKPTKTSPQDTNPEEELQGEDVPTKGEDRSSLKSLIGKAIGLDITKIAIPVSYNEPFSFLQRMMEYIQYNDLLKKASECEDPALRALYVGVFAITCFASTDRTVKPFNPLLGETFEYIDDKKNLRFVAEQVSHHPPIGASHCETPDFIYYQSQSVKTKFLGNSLDVTPVGVSSVVLKKWNEHYSWPNVRTIVHRLIIGKMWVDHFGDTTITIKHNGTEDVHPIKVDIKYKECGWFGRGWSDIEGKVLVPQGDKYVPVFTLTGKWTESISATASPLGKHLSDGVNDFSDEKPHLIWTHNAKLCTEKPYSKYDWTEFTLKLCEIDEDMRFSLPPSDARLREDRVWLQKGDTKAASKAKFILEEAQRTRRKTLEEDKAEYKPKYFDLQKTPDGHDVYVFNGKYWVERIKRTDTNIAEGTLTTDEDANKFWRLSAHHKEVSE